VSLLRQWEDFEQGLQPSGMQDLNGWELHAASDNPRRQNSGRHELPGGAKLWVSPERQAAQVDWVAESPSNSQIVEWRAKFAQAMAQRKTESRRGGRQA